MYQSALSTDWSRRSWAHAWSSASVRCCNRDSRRGMTHSDSEWNTEWNTKRTMLRNCWNTQTQQNIPTPYVRQKWDYIATSLLGPGREQYCCQKAARGSLLREHHRISVSWGPVLWTTETLASKQNIKLKFSEYVAESLLLICDKVSTCTLHNYHIFLLGRLFCATCSVHSLHEVYGWICVAVHAMFACYFSSYKRCSR